MEIFYVNTVELLKTHGAEFLKKYADGRKFKSEKRFIQYTAGRWLVKSAAAERFGLTDTEIVIENDKPKFKSGGINFSISHSGNFVAAAFDAAECGLDIEEIKPRDFAALGERYGREFRGAREFYKFWTEYEAAIKLQTEPRGKYQTVFEEKFMLTALSAGEIGSVALTQK